MVILPCQANTGLYPLDVFDKLLEKLMVTRLCRFLQQNNILYEYQFGFRQHYSTTFALIDVVEIGRAHV